MAEKKFKKHENPWDTGELVKFKLHFGRYMDPTKPERLTVNINGFKEQLEFGKVHEVPKQYLNEIRNAYLAHISNSPLSRFEHAVGGQGRPQSEIYQNASEIVKVPMYDVTEL